MKCLDEIEDCDDKTYAKSLLEWAINKRTFEAIPLSIILKNDTFFIALFLVLTFIEFSTLTTTIYNNTESKEI